MSGGDGNGPGNTGLGHNGGKPSGNINGSSGAGGASSGNGSSWSGFTASTFHDPISGGMGITLSGSSGNVTSSGTTGGVVGGGKREPQFVANVGGWKEGNTRDGGSLGTPVVSDSWSRDPNEVGYIVSFGREKYRVIRDANGNYRSKIAEGAAHTRDQMMDDQAIAIVKRFQLSKDEKSLLLGASAIISDAGNKLSGKLSAQYKTLATTIANDVKNFQGKKIRTLDDAMKTLNSIMASPTIKLSAADKTAVVNALKKLNATDMANKLQNLSKGFGVADRLLKVESIRAASVVGIETGNWKPLGLEVESMVLSGIAGSIATAIVAAVLAVIAVALPATVVTAISFMAIVTIAVASSFIDAAAADALNKALAGIFKRQ